MQLIFLFLRSLRYFIKWQRTYLYELRKISLKDEIENNWDLLGVIPIDEKFKKVSNVESIVFMMKLKIFKHKRWSVRQFLFYLFIIIAIPSYNPVIRLDRLKIVLMEKGTM